MGLLSILPESLRSIEVWITRFCLLFALLLIGPWLFFILYDILLYVWRTATYNIPVVGGRARGKQRPRAPSLTERPSGRTRQLSIMSPARHMAGHDHSAVPDASTGRQRSPDVTTPRTPSKSRD